MIYLDSGATSFPRPAGVIRAVDSALRTCANPGRGGYPASELASRLVFRCRERAAALCGGMYMLICAGDGAEDAAEYIALAQ